MERSRRIGNLQGTALTLALLGAAYEHRGRYNEAEARTIEALQLLERIGSPLLERAREQLTQIRQKASKSGGEQGSLCRLSSDEIGCVGHGSLTPGSLLREKCRYGPTATTVDHSGWPRRPGWRGVVHACGSYPAASKGIPCAIAC